MRAALVQQVWRRARSACEYCLLPQAVDILPCHIDHIIARKHDGPTVADNLALACFHCSLHKGANIAGIDPQGRKLTRLFNPRRDAWDEHFKWNGPVLVGLTPEGRTTIAVLAINRAPRVALRGSLIAEG
jgi:5-methylcytosine-specific restriction endonuclease McrA